MAPERMTPAPARMRGRLAWAMRSAARARAFGSARGAADSPGRSTVSGQTNSVVAWSASFVMSMSTGPGRPFWAITKASRTWRAMSPASVTSQLCLVMGRVMPVTSVSWKASVPTNLLDTWPVMKTVGTESSIAVAMPVVRLVAPGPEVAIATPTRPLARAKPSAMWAAPCSWRTST